MCTTRDFIRFCTALTFILFSVIAIVVLAVIYKSYADYNNVKVVETQCEILNYDIEQSRCGVKPSHICYKGFIVMNVTSINEYPVSLLYTYSRSYDTTLSDLQQRVPINSTITCYYEVLNTWAVTLYHDPHKPEEDALTAGLVFASLAGAVLLFGIIMEILWKFHPKCKNNCL